MTYELACWLAAKLDIFDLKVRGGKTKKGRENNDLYYSSGWAHGYKQAQTDARKASRGPRLPKAEPPPSTLETIEKPKPIAGEVGCEDENGMLTIHLESETCEVCAPELCRSCGKPPGQHDDDCINHAGQFGYEANRGVK